MKYVIALLGVGLAFGIAIGFLIGTSYATQSQCLIVGETLGDVWDTDRGNDAVRLSDGRWCLLK